MSTKHFSRCVLTSLLVAFLAANSHADWFDSFIKYEYAPDLGYIEIRSEDVRGRKYIEHMADQREQFADDGIYFGYGEGPPNVYLRSNTLGPHTVETRITIFAPIGIGYGGANWTSTVEIRIDEREKISCHFGYYAPGRQNVNSIRIFPEEDVILISGEKEDGHVFGWDVSLSLISDDDVITDKTLVARECDITSASTDADEDSNSGGMLERLVADMKGQILEFLESAGGVAPVADILENTYGIDSAMFVALFDLRKEGKVSWPGGSDAALSLRVMVGLSERIEKV